MADDDNKHDDSAADPWAGIEASSTPDLSEGLGFSFDEPAEPKAESEVDPFADVGAESTDEGLGFDALAAGGDGLASGGDAHATDDDVGGWLQEDAAEPVAPLSVFSPDEPAMSDDDVAAMLDGANPVAEASDGSREEAAGQLEVEATDEPAADDFFGQAVAEEPAGSFPFTSDEPVAENSEPSLVGGEPADVDSSWSGLEAATTNDGGSDAAFPFGDDAGPADDEAAAAFPADEGGASSGDSFPGGFGDAVTAGGAAVGGVAAGEVAAKKSKPGPRKPAPKPAKKSGLGQLVGIVLGGVMAIPITLAILIWGLQKDPFKVAKMVPEEYKFLLPQKLQGKKQVAVRGPDLAQAATLDSLPAADPAAAGGTGEPGAGATPSDPAAAAGPAGEKPMKPPGLDELANSVTLDPVAAEPAKPAAEPAPAPPPAPEPEPLDLSGLDAAVAEATTATEAVAAVDAGDKKGRLRALANWYKSLAEVAEELAMLERVAADSGRPLEAAPEQFTKLHEAITSEPGMLEQLGTWGRNWIGFKKRGSAGIVLPVTFDSATRLGPFWSAKVLLDDGTGTMEELAIVSRSEPAALTGDRIIVTGLLLDGDVIWATDCRKPTTEKPAAASALDGESF